MTVPLHQRGRDRYRYRYPNHDLNPNRDLNFNRYRYRPASITDPPGSLYHPVMLP